MLKIYTSNKKEILKIIFIAIKIIFFRVGISYDFTTSFVYSHHTRYQNSPDTGP